MSGVCNPKLYKGHWEDRQSDTGCQMSLAWLLLPLFIVRKKECTSKRNRRRRCRSRRTRRRIFRSRIIRSKRCKSRVRRHPMSAEV